MNILEQYIEKIQSVEPHTAEWTKEFADKQFVKVVLTSNCYGRTETRDHVWDTDEWEKIKAQGFYWA